MYLSLTYADVVQFFWMIWSIRAYFVRLNITYLPLGILSLNTFLNRHAVRWRSWLSHLSNTQKVLSSSLGRIILASFCFLLLQISITRADWQATCCHRTAVDCLLVEHQGPAPESTTYYDLMNDASPISMFFYECHK